MTNLKEIGESAAFSPYLGKLIKGLLGAILALMVAAIAWQVLSRYVLNAPSSFSEEFLRFSLIWLGLIGAGYCFVDNRHLNLPLLTDALPPRGQIYFIFFNSILSLVFGAFLIVGGWASLLNNMNQTTPMLKIPMGALQSVVVICGVMICVTQIRSIVLNLKHKTGALLLLAAAAANVLVLATAIAITWQSDMMTELTDTHLELTSTVVLFLTFGLLLILGSPIAIGLAFAGVLTLSLQLDFELVLPTVGETMFNGLDSFGFLALPFFILAGNIMNATGLARRLIDLAMLLGGRLSGSLWHTNVIANMLFGTLSGSGIAAATAIGSVVNPVAREKGYDMAMTTAVNAASAPAGMLIPPSGALIVYSLITGGSASIIALFMAGYVPGMIMGLSVMGVAYWYARKHGYDAEMNQHNTSEVVRICLRALPSLLLIIIIIAGILGGAFTAVEGSGIAVVYSLILALIYRALPLRKLMEILIDTALMSGTILFLIACSTMMSWSMTFASIPDTIGMLLTAVSDNKYVILLLINFMLLVVGVFMDMSPALLIFTPILFPVVTELGVDPVHFGIILVYNLSMGVVTPPVGTVLFVSCSISGERISRVIKPLLPIFALQIIGLLLVTFVPALSMALPRMLGL